MDYQEEINNLKIIVEQQAQQIEMMKIALDELGGRIDGNTSDLTRVINAVKPIIPVIGNTTYQLFEGNTITSITVDKILYNLKANDVIIVNDLYNEIITEFIVSDNTALGGTAIPVNSTTLSNTINGNSLVMFSIVRDTDHKLEIEH